MVGRFLRPEGVDLATSVLDASYVAINCRLVLKVRGASKQKGFRAMAMSQGTESRMGRSCSLSMHQCQTNDVTCSCVQTRGPAPGYCARD
eukprot:6199488-Pleurochrysis_carterae.AAC.2